ncbi:hypothetical protein ACX0G9_09825 [Flavitalea flava]
MLLPSLFSTERQFKALIFNNKNFMAMKIKVLIAGLLLISSFTDIHAQDKCPNVVVVRKTLYDSFQRTKADVGNIERSLTKAKQVRDDLYRQYRQCEHQSDIADMLKQWDADVQNLEANLKPENEAYKLLEQELRLVIHNANGVPAVYRYYDAGYGNLGSVVTMTFLSQGERILVVPTYNQLPDPVASIK